MFTEIKQVFNFKMKLLMRFKKLRVNEIHIYFQVFANACFAFIVEVGVNINVARQVEKI